MERGIEWWQSQGYRVKLADGVFENDDWIAGEAEARARDLESLFADPEVDVVQCFRGGYGSAQLIPFLDFDLIAANPKPFVGFSDITALHESIRQADRPCDVLRAGPDERRQYGGVGAHARATAGPAARRDRRGAAVARRSRTFGRSRAAARRRRSSAAASGC